MSDEAKVRFLFKRIQHSSLRSSIEALKAQMTSGVHINYTMAAKHLTTAVSELPEFISKNNRSISAVGSTNSNGSSSDIYNSDGSIITGHIPTWRTLSQADRDIVKAERNRLGTKKGKKNKSSNNNDSNRMKQLSDHNKKLKRQIKALQRKGSSSGDGGTADDTTMSDNDEADAGDQFGGKLSKKKQKKN